MEEKAIKSSLVGLPLILLYVNTSPTAVFLILLLLKLAMSSVIVVREWSFSNNKGEGWNVRPPPSCWVKNPNCIVGL